jgi:hypothetical protein
MSVKLRRNLTYANIAVLAVVAFVMSSGAYAASRYLITSINQISPKVISQLPVNADSSLTSGNVLLHGRTEIGVWGFSNHGTGIVREPLSFPIPLARPIGEDSVDVIEPGEEGKQFAKECPGTLERPAAIPGYLCMYSSQLEAPYFGDGTPSTGGIVLVFAVFTEKSGAFGTSDEGTWAVSGA